MTLGRKLCYVSQGGSQHLNRKYRPCMSNSVGEDHLQHNSSDMNYLRRLSGETQAWSGGAVKDHKLACEEYVPIDRKANPHIGLDATKAH